MTTSAASSTYTLGESITSPSTISSFPGSSAIHSSSTLSGSDHLRDLFNKRILSLIHLKRSLHGQRTWFSTIQLTPSDLSSAFDNDRMHKRTLRYSLLGLSLSSILEISNSSDMARATISLINELDSYTDDNIVIMTTGTSTASFGTQRPKVRNFFKSGKPLKRATAAQAISEFGNMDSTSMGNDQASYLMVPNIAFQLDFFQTFFTLCDMLIELYYKMLSFLPRDTAIEGGPEGKLSSPISASHAVQDDRTVNISQALSDLYSESASEKGGPSGNGLSGTVQELLLKADAKIKKTINAQVKDIDILARQTIKDELASLDPLMKDLGFDTGSTSSSVFPSSNSGAGSTSSLSGSGLPTTASALPFGFSNQSSSASVTPPTSIASSTQSKVSTFIPASSLPSHFRRGTVKPDLRTSSHDASQGHHHLNISTPSNGAGANLGADTVATMGSLIRSRSGKLRRVMSGDKEPREDASVPVYPSATGPSPSKDS